MLNSLNKRYKINLSVSLKTILLFACLLLVLIFGTVVTIDLSESERFKRKILELQHIPAFFILGLFLLSVFERPIIEEPDFLGTIFQNKLSFFKQVLLSFLIILGFSLLTESIQPYFGRDSSYHDLNLNIFGALLGLSFQKVFWQRKFFYKFLWVLFFILGISFFLRPIYIEWQVSVNKTKQFPVLAAVGEKDIDWWGEYANKTEIDYLDGFLEIKFYAGLYSGVSYEAFGQDWSQYELLEISLFNPGEEFMLSVRIDDQNETTFFGQRFDRNYKIKPGDNKLEIKIEVIREGPSKRILDMKKISALHLFTSKDKKNRNLRLKRVELK